MFAFTVILLAYAVGALGLTVSLPSDVQIDVVWPQNDTYYPTATFPIAFNIQNAAAIWDFDIYFVWNLTRGGSDDYADLNINGIRPFPYRGAEDLFTPDVLSINSTTALTNVTDEAHWRLGWKMGFNTNCLKNGSEDKSYDTDWNTLWFTTSVKAKPANLSALPECLPFGGAFRVESRTVIPMNDSRYLTARASGCAVMSSTPPTQHSCDLPVRAHAASQIQDFVDYYDYPVCSHKPLSKEMSSYCQPKSAAIRTRGVAMMPLVALVFALVGCGTWFL